jgi:phospholipase C
MTDERIKYVFVLMLENRSFDHMLGYLNQGCMPPLSTSDGVRLDPADDASEFVPATWLDSYVDVAADPGHGYDDVMRQLTGVDLAERRSRLGNPAARRATAARRAARTA